jgi:ADP-ribosyl-[dinitrogen reductase] hydrolase
MFNSKAKKYEKSFLQFNKSPDDRNWNWKDANFTYSPRRLKQQPGYIGSYCMDALSMALHTVWHTKNFK